MALYRNIAGVNSPGAVGLTLFTPTTVELSPTSATDFRNLLDTKLQTSEEIYAQIWAATNAKYDWLLSHSLAEVTAAGYYVTEDNGSIFQWTDAAHTTSVAYLPIQDIQEVENARGTAGTLLLHLQQPALAKDTAGYAGGASASWAEANPYSGTGDVYSTPIPEVQDLPPVISDGAGGVTFEYTGPMAIPTGTTPTTTTTTTTTTPNTTATAVKSNIAPLVALTALVAVAIGGDAITGRRTNLIFAGGVGALFYLMAKRSK